MVTSVAKSKALSSLLLVTFQNLLYMVYYCLSMKYNCFAFKGITSNIFITGEHKQVTEVIFSSTCYARSFIHYIGSFLTYTPSLGFPISLTGISKGRGFCGVIKRYSFSSSNRSHGNSKSHNKPGSIGMCQDPGRVFKGKRMSGHKGFSSSYLMNLRIILIEHNRIIVLGCIPGSFGSKVFF
ncbi:50S ribosomal protein L3 [Candidatus Vidania fulgoroideorum]